MKKCLLAALCRNQDDSSQDFAMSCLENFSTDGKLLLRNWNSTTRPSAAIPQDKDQPVDYALQAI